MRPQRRSLHGRNLMRTLAGAAAAVALLSACSSPDDQEDAGGAASETTAPAVPVQAADFVGVCSGATESRASDYASSDEHKLVYFETLEDDLLEQSSRMPTDWTVQNFEDLDAFAAVDLVACAERTGATKVKTCDDYDIDETGERGTVNWHTATYDLRVFEAKTGSELASTTIRAGDKDCPMFVTFDEGELEIDEFAVPSDSELTKFLRPFVQP